MNVFNNDTMILFILVTYQADLKSLLCIRPPGDIHFNRINLIECVRCEHFEESYHDSLIF